MRGPGNGCEARFSDRVLANRFIYHFRDPERGADRRLQDSSRRPGRLQRRHGRERRRHVRQAPDRAPGGALARAERVHLHQRQEAGRAVRRARPPGHGHDPREDDPERPLLDARRQPRVLVRLTALGHRSAREPGRPGLRGLLAAGAHRLQVSRGDWRGGSATLRQAPRPSASIQARPAGPPRHDESHRASRTAPAAD